MVDELEKKVSTLLLVERNSKLREISYFHYFAVCGGIVANYQDLRGQNVFKREHIKILTI